MTDLTLQRRFFADEIEMIANLRSRGVALALATVAREEFLPPGPWTVRSEADFQQPPRVTRDADPRHVYHNVAIALDASRMLFNGAPSLVGMAIDALGLEPGQRVLHVGTGTGYYTAILAHCVGAGGRVLGIEVDEPLAAEARRRLAPWPCVEVRHGDSTGPLGEPFDAILINAGVTHPQPSWLDALAPGGRLILPLTATAPTMLTIGKGLLVALTRTENASALAARVVTFVAIYSGLGLRNEEINRRLGESLMKSPIAPLRRLRLDAHERIPSCWLHEDTHCWSV